MHKVIRADSSHAENIAKFNQAMALETEHKKLLWDQIFPGVQSLISSTSRGFYLIAADEQPLDQQERESPKGTSKGNITGCLGVTYEWSDWRNGVFWWIQSVYVDPDHRSTGVFSAMYAEVKRLAVSSGNACGVRLYVEKDNERAYQTYIKLGMIETDYRLMEEEF
ncbi:MAG: ribosomal protein S18 acetylase RimI-like enzyme [Candidatus Azotimanducaceae bacterium]|jgi:ribosomal protein S18 acetylase RimI-like enzyme